MIVSPTRLKWTRPTTLPFPKIWSTHQVERAGTTHKIRIQDIPEDRHEDVVQFMTQVYLKDEPMFRSLNISEDEISKETYRFIWLESLRQNASIMSVLDNDDEKPEILGTEIIYITTKEDGKLPELAGVSYNKTSKFGGVLFSALDPFEHFGVNEVLRERGLCVAPENRSLGIGTLLFDTFPKLGKSFGVKAAMTQFSSIRSQKIAEKLGYKVYNEIPYKDYKDENGKPMFTSDDTEIIKLMAIKFFD